MSRTNLHTANGSVSSTSAIPTSVEPSQVPSQRTRFFRSSTLPSVPLNSRLLSFSMFTKNTSPAIVTSSDDRDGRSRSSSMSNSSSRGSEPLVTSSERPGLSAISKSRRLSKIFSASFLSKTSTASQEDNNLTFHFPSSDLVTPSSSTTTNTSPPRSSTLPFDDAQPNNKGVGPSNPNPESKQPKVVVFIQGKGITRTGSPSANHNQDLSEGLNQSLSQSLSPKVNPTSTSESDSTSPPCLENSSSFSSSSAALAAALPSLSSPSSSEILSYQSLVSAESRPVVDASALGHKPSPVLLDPSGGNQSCDSSSPALTFPSSSASSSSASKSLTSSSHPVISGTTSVFPDSNFTHSPTQAPSTSLPGSLLDSNIALADLASSSSSVSSRPNDDRLAVTSKIIQQALTFTDTSNQLELSLLSPRNTYCKSPVSLSNQVSSNSRRSSSDNPHIYQTSSQIPSATISNQTGADSSAEVSAVAKSSGTKTNAPQPTQLSSVMMSTKSEMASTPTSSSMELSTATPGPASRPSNDSPRMDLSENEMDSPLQGETSHPSSSSSSPPAEPPSQRRLVQSLVLPESLTENDKEEDPYSIRLTPFIDHSSTTPSLYISAVERKAHNGIIIRVGRYTERKETPAPKPEHAPIVFKSKVVSRSHAQLTVNNGEWFVQDVKSSSGTFLNHIRLSPACQQSVLYPLKDGDILQLGMDFRGGSEEIYKCIKVRIEVNKSWQKRVNNFK